MPRKISYHMISESLKPESSEAVFILLTITHNNIKDGPIRVVNNNEDVMSRGEKFLSYPFIIELPSSKDDEIPQARLTIDNIDLKILYGLSLCGTSPVIKVEIVMESTPDTVELVYDQFRILSYSFNATQITAVLGFDAFYDSPFPKDIYSPKNFSGLFKNVK